MKMLVESIVLFLLPAACLAAPTNETDDEAKKNYGVTWMYFPDGNGNPQEINLTEAEMQGKSGNLEDSVHFYLYTRLNKDLYSELVLNDNDEESENEIETGPPFGDDHFDPKKEVKILVHGWRSSGESETVVSIKNAYLEDRECNAIIVDWSELASNLIYLIPAYNTKVVGRKTAKLINHLIQEYDMTLDQFHIIGHSLGAHVSGYAGSCVKSGKISRITGLDPAKPGFENFNVVEDRLDPTDAQFVDVIHTCAKVLGFQEPLGTVDFYPNGGTPPQPGCEGLIQMTQACSHGRSYVYFVESIQYAFGFPSRYCPDEKNITASGCHDDKDPNGLEIYMGDAVSRQAQGVFYLTTNSEAPFHKGDNDNNVTDPI